MYCASCDDPALYISFESLAQWMIFETYDDSANEGNREDIANLELERRIDNIFVVGLRGRQDVEESAQLGKVVPCYIGHHENRA